jgi:hypothetical protein
MALTLMMSVGMNGKVRIKQQKIEIRKLDYAIAAIFLSTILLTIIGNVLFDIPPVLSFLAGLSVMFIIARLCKRSERRLRVQNDNAGIKHLHCQNQKY